MSDYDDDEYGGNEDADINPSEYLLDDAEAREDDAEDTDNPQYQGESEEDNMLIDHQQEDYVEDEEAVEARREAADFDALGSVALKKEPDGFSIHKMEVDTTGVELSSSGRAKITTRYLTKYEKARLLGTRALQLSMNAPPW